MSGSESKTAVGASEAAVEGAGGAHGGAPPAASAARSDASSAGGAGAAATGAGAPCAPSQSEAMKVGNPHLRWFSTGEADFLYHLGLDTSLDLPAMFGDVRAVAMHGSHERAAQFARRAAKAMRLRLPVGAELAPVGKTERYTLFKVGPVISVSHGIGVPSISVLLHELVKLLHYARNRHNPLFMRLGTCGGLGVEPGTVIAARHCVNGRLEAVHETWVLGKPVRRATTFDAEAIAIAEECAKGVRVDAERQVPPGEEAGPRAVRVLADDDGLDIPMKVGVTLTADGFYEEQGRLDGAICDYTAADRARWLQQCRDAGVVNIEMEAILLASVCNKLGLRAISLNTVIINRMEGDMLAITGADVANLSSNAQRLALRMLSRMGLF